MKIIETELKGVCLIKPQFFGDGIGWFIESYNYIRFQEAGIDIKFTQESHCFSASKGTIRGLNYKMNPKAQTKLVRCIKGAIFDVAVDIRKDSENYGKWYGVELTEENRKQLLVPKGFAHGFMSLTDNVEVQYKMDEISSPGHERKILWSDPNINIDWPLEVKPVLSVKDKNALTLKDADNNFSAEEY
ncbi:dTDP-4-dehydrorhamnose 3,5-epimerase [Virgibacillus necropolis]|uniref:dTDP-4-dehydrorhamnose 3,5-epimerase n=1 Tax=Virgibacillus necropolis TaxID=163877 RepID=A0A221MCJ3_9BACI|nr:dTDP-4-dehydrorhamnose 3,5-epimerase [Virgibacillus necropolis]ASN05375.1 dTDP-4-dehydrorhamnose 3,5-epimerase [Virgibacillus necropolis]